MNGTDQKKAEFIKGYENYSDAIYRFCYIKTSDKNAALDITQETFTRAWEYITEGKEIGHLRGFLYQIARNLIIDFHRKKKSSSLEALADYGFDPPDETKDDPDVFMVRDALDAISGLDEKYKDLLIMRYVDDMPIKEIAKTIGEQENTISVRIHRALERVRNLIEQKYETES